MRQAPTPERIPVATLALCSHTGESGEAYDADVQTLPGSEEDNLLTLVRPFKVSNLWPDNSESGEAYEAEAEECQRNKLPEEPIAITVPIDGKSFSKRSRDAKTSIFGNYCGLLTYIGSQYYQWDD